MSGSHGFSPYRHALELLASMRRQASEPRPSFRVSRVKGVGGATVIEWDAQVPVCEEYPTASEAFQAAIRFADGFDLKYAPKDTLLADLQASVSDPPLRFTREELRAGADLEASVTLSPEKPQETVTLLPSIGAGGTRGLTKIEVPCPVSAAT